MARSTQANYLHAVRSAQDELTRAQAEKSRADARVAEAQSRLSQAQALAGVTEAGSPVNILANDVADAHTNSANADGAYHYLPQPADITGTGRTHS